jgi:hypothetical protein
MALVAAAGAASGILAMTRVLRPRRPAVAARESGRRAPDSGPADAEALLLAAKNQPNRVTGDGDR